MTDTQKTNQPPKAYLQSSPIQPKHRPITTLSEARKASRQGVFASLLISGITLVMVLSSLSGDLPEDISSVANIASLPDVFISLLIAWGIHRMSRIAAISGLVLHVISRLVVYQLTDVDYTLFDMVLASALAWCFLNAVRGTFAYHRLKNSV
ncbi:hypothetical protein D0962_37410 [Leptolyngbyaceae cyanobacterium CCMR0082]|uniref:Uncharacterized protein n=1 Tax=Adonisia turfae CCMR0082 TaxID=2304604 RepID=A0A6M0SKB7_9CYAN|nr:hypothetical protein [Adonisia turfae]NEZ68341.1 hypothetical protein [Adonisia turfae CCMR0082]